MSNDPTPRNTGAPRGPRQRIAILVAMESEIAPLLRKWRQDGKKVRRWEDERHTAASAYRCDGVLVLCSGIGRKPAAMAARAVIDYYQPELLISAGLAGATSPKLAVGKVLRAVQVVDATTGEKYATRDVASSGVLVTAGTVVSSGQKEEMAQKFGADAVDMEAAVVAEIARAAGVPFVSVKAISDAVDFEMPPLDRFIDSNGRVHLLKLISWAALRPQIWPRLNELRRNSQLAAEALARELGEIVEQT